MNRKHGLATALTLLAITGLVPACGSSSSDVSPPAPAGPAPDGGDGPKAKQVEGTPDATDINETLGVFVAPRGSASGEGSRERPLLGLQAAIDLGKKLGKRVYVCTGTYREALTLADSISVIGGLDCSGPLWKPGAAKSRIEAPSSPAVSAKDIASATRLEGLEIVAPDAATPSGSSIGLLAVGSRGLTIAATAITAGNGASGAAGEAGLQLTAGNISGAPAIAPFQCVGRGGGPFPMAATCASGVGGFLKPPSGAAGRTGACLGVAGHDGGRGGSGGSGGISEAVAAGVIIINFWQPVNRDPSNGADPGEVRSGAPGADATAAPQASMLGALSPDGYTATDGVNGTDGTPGEGGSGAAGSSLGLPSPASVVGQTWTGTGGGSGGAGGCPGLAGTAGKGGGASIAVALVESPLVLDGATLRAGKAGGAGLGSFGSDPTTGGIATDPNAKNGGRGGFAGVSTNGSNGPSLGILHSGPAPKLTGTKILPGAGGAAIDARVRTVLGTTQTIPATAAGLSEEVHAL